MGPIQELVDENRHLIPLELAKQLLELSAKVEAPKLARVRYTKVTAAPFMTHCGCSGENDTDVALNHSEHDAIVQLYDEKDMPRKLRHKIGMQIEHGMINSDRLSAGPFTHHWANSVFVIHSVLPFLKRERE